MLDCLFVDFNASDERLQYLGSEFVYFGILLGIVDEVSDTLFAHLHLIKLCVKSDELCFQLGMFLLKVSGEDVVSLVGNFAVRPVQIEKLYRIVKLSYLSLVLGPELLIILELLLCFGFTVSHCHRIELV